MRSLIRPTLARDTAPSRDGARADPAPSRLAYRIARMRLSPAYRVAVRLGVPLVVIGGILGGLMATEARREALWQTVADIRAEFETRPEFMVSVLAIDGASPAVAETLRAILPLNLPQSSFHLDLDALRLTAQTLPAVRLAAVQVRAGGILQVDVTERVPVALWRTRDGLVLVDAEGVAVRPAGFRDDHPELPLIAGDGASAAVPEALRIMAAAGPLTPRLRGLVRVGERRWDVVLDQGQRIFLPEDQPARALERAIAMDQAKDLLGRDVAAVDLRVPERLTVRMGQPAADEWWKVRALLLGNGNG